TIARTSASERPPVAYQDTPSRCDAATAPSHPEWDPTQYAGSEDSVRIQYASERNTGPPVSSDSFQSKRARSLRTSHASAQPSVLVSTADTLTGTGRSVPGRTCT